ncbi:hypothetical protein BOX15_Mlig004902g1, partial [Macrostomum lignano]
DLNLTERMLNKQTMGDYSQHQAPYLMQNFAYSGGQIGVDVGSVWSTGAPAADYAQQQQYSPEGYYQGNSYGYPGYMQASPHQTGYGGGMWNPVAAAAAAAAANSFESGDLTVWPGYAHPPPPPPPPAPAGYAPMPHQPAATAASAVAGAQSANNGTADSVAVLEQGIAGLSVQQQQQQQQSDSSAVDFPALSTSTAGAAAPKTWAKIAASQAPVGPSGGAQKPASGGSAPGEPVAVPVAIGNKAGNPKALGKGTGGLVVGHAAGKQQQPARGNAASMAPGQGYVPQYQQQQQPASGNRGQLQSLEPVPAASEEQLRQLEQDINPAKHDVPDNSEFYVIKSYSEDDIHRAIKYSIWCSTKRGNEVLNGAFSRTANRGGRVYLLFSVNGSGHFCGVAQMITQVDVNKNAGVWCQDKWLGEFKIKWIYVKDVPNSQLRHVRVATNENKPVTNSRDCTNVPIEQGRQVLGIIRSYRHSTSIFDDFSHYEKRELEGNSPS